MQSALRSVAGPKGAVAVVVALVIAVIAVVAGGVAGAAQPPQLMPNEPGAVKAVQRDNLESAVQLNDLGDKAPPTNAAGLSLMVQQYAASHKASDGQAEHVITEQVRGTGMLQVLKERLGDDLLGVRYDDENAKWEIALTPTADRSIVDELTSARELTDPVVERPSWTDAQRIDTLKRLQDKYAAKIDDNLISIDDAGTELEIRASPKLDADEVDQLRSAAADLQVDTRVVIGSPSGGEATPMYDCNNIWCNAPVRAGERWIQQSNGSYCTTAFPVTSGADTYHGWVLTAGHCLYGHYGGEASKCSLSWCGHLGTEFSGYYGGGDAGLIKIDDPGRWPTYGVWWLPYAWTGGADSLPTRPQYLPAVGEYICHVGSGYAGSPPGADDEVASCGTVINNNHTINNAAAPGLPAATLYNMITTQGGCGQKGNSGGPLLNAGTGSAIGIASSGSVPADGTRACNSTITMNYEYVANSLLNLGVSLRTS
jgi:hypothetical protein